MTNLETLVLNGIKYLQSEYADGVPVNIMKLDLGLSDDDLRETLLSLEDQGIIFIEGERIKIIQESAADDSGLVGDDFKSVRDDSRMIPDDSGLVEDNLLLNKEDPDLTRDNSGLKGTDVVAVKRGKTKNLTENLTEKEQQALDIINELAGDSGRVSRHILEGNLLYGDLKLTNLGSYNLVLSLESKGIIKKIQRADGEYYSIIIRI